MAGFSIVTSSVCSLDCVWQALGVEHVSLHSSLASHLQVLYFIIFLIQRSLNVLQSANLNCASISTKIQFRSTDSIRLKETDLLREQNLLREQTSWTLTCRAASKRCVAFFPNVSPLRRTTWSRCLASLSPHGFKLLGPSSATSHRFGRPQQALRPPLSRPPERPRRHPSSARFSPRIHAPESHGLHRPSTRKPPRWTSN